MKNVTTVLKNSLERFNMRFEQQKSESSNLKTVQINYSSLKRKKRKLKKTEHSHAGITGYPHRKEGSCILSTHNIQQLNQSGLKT